MLTTGLLHPEILAALAAAGHGSEVLVTDGNYPASTASPAGAVRVHLNLSPGVVGTQPVVDALLDAVVVEHVTLMQPNVDGPYTLPGDPPVWEGYREALCRTGFTGEVEQLDRFAFYERARGDDVALVVVTAETQWYANVMLRIGALATPTKEVHRAD